MVENEITWQDHLTNRVKRTRSGGSITQLAYENAIDIRQTANEGDFVSIEELMNAREIVQIVHAMPEKLAESIRDGNTRIPHDYVGNYEVESLQDSEIE